jgi:hypothetical protein
MTAIIQSALREYSSIFCALFSDADQALRFDLVYHLFLASWVRLFFIPRVAQY